MTKLCLNYESGQYEYIDEDGFSWDQHKYVNNWDDSEYRREREEREQEEKRRRNRFLWDDDDDYLF